MAVCDIIIIITLIIIIIIIIGSFWQAIRRPKQGSSCFAKKTIPFSMATENVQLVHACFPKHLRMGKETESKLMGQRNRGRRKGKKSEYMERSTWGIKIQKKNYSYS